MDEKRIVRYLAIIGGFTVVMIVIALLFANWQ